MIEPRTKQQVVAVAHALFQLTLAHKQTAGKADVVVIDVMLWNVLCKTIEGLVKGLARFERQALIDEHFLARTNGALQKTVLRFDAHIVAEDIVQKLVESQRAHIILAQLWQDTCDVAREGTVW